VKVSKCPATFFPSKLKEYEDTFTRYQANFTLKCE